MYEKYHVLFSKRVVTVTPQLVTNEMMLLQVA